MTQRHQGRLPGGGGIFTALWRMDGVLIRWHLGLALCVHKQRLSGNVQCAQNRVTNGLTRWPHVVANAFPGSHLPCGFLSIVLSPAHKGALWGVFPALSGQSLAVYLVLCCVTFSARQGALCVVLNPRFKVLCVCVRTRACWMHTQSSHHS